MTDATLSPGKHGAPGTPGAPGTSPEASYQAPQGTWHELRRRPVFLLTGGCALLLLLLAAAPGLFAGWFGHGDPTVCELGHSAEGPAPGHPFGYDVQGCDLYANVIHGAGASLGVGLLATGLGLAVALVLGCLAGMAGRTVDSVIARITDVFLGFPFLLGAIVVLNSFTTRDVPTVAGVLALFGWPTMTRVVRASVRSVREADYVVMARSLGASQWHIVRRHVLPNALTPVLVLATITVGGVIVAEAALTFLGVGLQPPSISWGLQLAGAQNSFQTHPHLLIFPGLFLSFTVFVLITFGDTVRDALDPRGR
ncbi:ABC transporter permease [Streptomyces umbrinus]|uniref:ABC transporter permease n=1 Tax=Streptomyces umbrinus TaxID=67370 RepID=UPI003C30123B